MFLARGGSILLHPRLWAKEGRSKLDIWNLSITKVTSRNQCGSEATFPNRSKSSPIIYTLQSIHISTHRRLYMVLEKSWSCACESLSAAFKVDFTHAAEWRVGKVQEWARLLRYPVSVGHMYLEPPYSYLLVLIDRSFPGIHRSCQYT